MRAIVSSLPSSRKSEKMAGLFTAGLGGGRNRDLPQVRRVKRFPECAVDVQKGEHKVRPLLFLPLCALLYSAPQPRFASAPAAKNASMRAALPAVTALPACLVPRGIPVAPPAAPPGWSSRRHARSLGDSPPPASRRQSCPPSAAASVGGRSGLPPPAASATRLEHAADGWSRPA